MRPAWSNIAKLQSQAMYSFVLCGSIRGADSAISSGYLHARMDQDIVFMYQMHRKKGPCLFQTSLVDYLTRLDFWDHYEVLLLDPTVGPLIRLLITVFQLALVALPCLLLRGSGSSKDDNYNDDGQNNNPNPQGKK